MLAWITPSLFWKNISFAPNETIRPAQTTEVSAEASVS